MFSWLLIFIFPNNFGLSFLSLAWSLQSRHYLVLNSDKDLKGNNKVLINTIPWLLTEKLQHITIITSCTLTQVTRKIGLKRPCGDVGFRTVITYCLLKTPLSTYCLLKPQSYPRSPGRALGVQSPSRFAVKQNKSVSTHSPNGKQFSGWGKGIPSPHCLHSNLWTLVIKRGGGVWKPPTELNRTEILTSVSSSLLRPSFGWCSTGA